MGTRWSAAGRSRGAGGTVSMADAKLDVEQLTLRFGGVVALDGVAFSVDRGTICGLIGPNGAGKTTVFNVISGIYRPESGSVRWAGCDVLTVAPHRVVDAGIARTFQNLALWPGMSVLENVMVGAHRCGRQTFLRAALRVGTAREERRLVALAHEILHDLGLAPLAHRPAAGLPYGTLKRIEIARALAAGPSLLLLDEPAAGLTHGEVDELADLLRRIRHERDLTIVLVEHHMPLVMGISDQVVVLDLGRTIASGTPEHVQQHPDVVAAYLGAVDV